MRRAGMTKAAIAAELGIHPKTLQGWFRQDGVAAPPPQRSPEVLAREAARAARRAQRTGRPFPGSRGHAPELREQAAAMRRDGVGRAEIARRLEIGASTVARWFRQGGVPVNHIGRAAAAEGVRRTVAERWAHQDAEQVRWGEAVGQLTDREVLLVGAALYWAEGAKAKPWRRSQKVVFINSDVTMIQVFLRYLALVGVSRADITCWVSIHESADVAAATAAWRRDVGEDLAFNAPQLKRHNASPHRHNTGVDYRGCLAIYVRRGAALYRRLAGTWQGVAEQCRTARSPVV